MTSPPDKHFRDHLEHFKKSPPPRTWSMIDSGLNKNKSKRIWLSAAATIIILLIASFLLWRSNESPKHAPMVTIDNGNKIENENKPVTSASPNDSEPASTPINYPANNVNDKPENSKSRSKVNLPSQEEMSNASEVVVEIQEEKSVAQSIAPEEINSSSTSDSIVTNEMTSTISRSYKIIYSSGEVNSRFLKKDTTTSNPSPEKSISGIQKIFDLASGFKYDETALGDLREMKNEIFSLPRKEPTKEKL